MDQDRCHRGRLLARGRRCTRQSADSPGISHPGRGRTDGRLHGAGALRHGDHCGGRRVRGVSVRTRAGTRPLPRPADRGPAASARPLISARDWLIDRMRPSAPRMPITTVGSRARVGRRDARVGRRFRGRPDRIRSTGRERAVGTHFPGPAAANIAVAAAAAAEAAARRAARLRPGFTGDNRPAHSRSRSRLSRELRSLDSELRSADEDEAAAEADAGRLPRTPTSTHGPTTPTPTRSAGLVRVATRTSAVGWPGCLGGPPGWPCCRENEPIMDGMTHPTGTGIMGYASCHAIASRKTSRWA